MEIKKCKRYFFDIIISKSYDNLIYIEITATKSRGNLEMSYLAFFFLFS
jgi:hypothetical protein